MSGSLLGSRVECEGVDTSFGDSDTKTAETCKCLHGMPAIKVSGTKYEIGEETYHTGVCSMYMVGGDIVLTVTVTDTHPPFYSGVRCKVFGHGNCERRKL